MGKFVAAKGLYKRFLEYFSYSAVVNPFSMTCHILEKYRYSSIILKHEEIHFSQIQRDGKILFCIYYWYYMLRYGYYNNPYEIEARK